MEPSPSMPKIADYHMQLSKLRDWEEAQGVPRLLSAFEGCTAWPGSAGYAAELEKAYYTYLQWRMHVEPLVQQVSYNPAAATASALAEIDAGLDTVAQALAVVEAVTVAGSEACYQWAIAQAKEIADSDFANQLRSAHEKIVSAKAVGYGGGTIATVIGSLAGGPIGGLVVGGIVGMVGIAGSMIAKDRAIAKALKDPDKVADLAGKQSTLSAANERKEKAGDYTGYASEAGYQASNIGGVVADVVPGALDIAGGISQGAGGLGTALAPFAFLADANAATRKEAASPSAEDAAAIGEAVRLSWQQRTGTTVEASTFVYLGYADGRYHVMIDGEGYTMDEAGTITSQAELVALEALALAAGKPADPPTVVVHWQLMRYAKRLPGTFCFLFVGPGTSQGSDVTVECSVDPDGNWYATLPGHGDLLATSTASGGDAQQAGPSALLACADLMTALDTGVVLLCVQASATGRYRIDEQEQEYLWLTGPEQSHLQSLVSQYNANR